jgi:hypothetical protein
MVSIKSEEDGTIVWTGCIDSIEEAGSIYLVGKVDCSRSRESKSDVSDT